MSGVTLGAGDTKVERLPLPWRRVWSQRETHVRTVSVGNKGKLCYVHSVQMQR